MLPALAGICVLFGGAGCAGGSGTSSIAIPPAKGRPQLPPRNAVVQARQDGRLAVALATQPAKGGDRMIATIVDPANVGSDGLDVSFRRGSARRAGTPCGSGCYSAVLPKTGPRAVDVDVAGRTVEFQLPARWPAPDATALVRRANRTYRNLRSIAYAQRLASAPGVEVFSHWQEGAPDRFAYRIPGGAAGIAIGSRRWDRTKPSSAWIESTTSPTRMPSPIWGLQTTNAHVLRTGTLDGRRVVTISLLARSVPAWFTIDFEAGTLRPLALRMTAAAHFMHNAYTGFNSGPKIRPPR